MTAMLSLFPTDLPPGFRYEGEVLSASEESALLAMIREVTFAAFEMRGVVARRRVAFFGQAYDATRPSAPMPPFLLALRQRAAAWAGADPEALVMALINEYRPGAPIGWHRDAPQYGIVAGLSLGSSCRMKFRPYVSPRALAAADDRTARPARKTTHELTLAPRSAYLMTGPSRTSFEHSIPAVHGLRYSVTFRTLRRR